jgi:Ca-activated chloride channel homolog
MFMPKLGTMHRRNSLPNWILTGIVFVVVAGLVSSGPARAQTSLSQAPQTQPSPPAPAPSAQAPADQPPAGGQATGPQAPPSAGEAPAAKPPAGQTPSSGELPSATDNGVFVFRKEVDEVTLHATVVDDKNHIITNLDRGSFSVFENDQPQQIKSFRREDYPVAMGIVIDNSGSMREKRDQVNKAALNLVRSSNPQDQVFIVNFNDEYYLDQEFTSDIKKLQAALEKVEARGGTALYDAIVASWTDELAHSPLQRKVIFVVTDGEDDASQLSLEQALHVLQQENGPVVYAIGLLGDEKARKAKRALELIADRTGGIAFFPPTLGQVDDISKTVAHDIRNQYTITFASTTPKSVSGFRTVRVDAHAKAYKKLSVRTRAGYYPGQER